MSAPHQEPPIIVGIPADEAEHAKALQFLNGVAFRWHQSAPAPPPQILFAAWRGSEVIGTIGLDFHDGTHLLPLQHIYDFDPAKTPLPFSPPTIAQIGRWTAAVPNISGALISYASDYALSCGKRYGCSEVKDKIALRFAELGIILHFITDARLKIENVREDRRPYYLSPPSPKPCMVEYDQMKKALQDIVAKEVEAGHCIFKPFFA